MMICFYLFHAQETINQLPNFVGQVSLIKNRPKRRRKKKTDFVKKASEIKLNDQSLEKVKSFAT